MVKVKTDIKIAVLVAAITCLLILISLVLLKKNVNPTWKTAGNILIKIDTLILTDTSNNQLNPVLLYSKNIDSGKDIKVAIIAPGRGIKNSDYSYISSNLVSQGYVVASVQYELPEDGVINIRGNIYEALKSNWEKNAKSLLFVLQYLKSRYPNLNCQNLTLIGHSMGGDILMLFAEKYPELVSNVISLDNCHMPLLRAKKPRILSLRANNTTPDKGVLPTPEEQKEYNIQIFKLPNVSHIEMCFGSELQKEEINRYITDFLKKD